MNWDILGAISSFVASVATLLTLVYLAIQVRESNKLARTASLKSILDDFIEHSVINNLNHPELGEIFDRGQKDYDKLSDKEKALFEGMLTRDVLQLQNVMQQHEQGLLSDVDYQAWLSYISSQLTSPGGKECWKHTKRTFTPTLVSALDEHIRDNPSAPTFVDLFSHRLKSGNSSDAAE